MFVPPSSDRAKELGPTDSARSTNPSASREASMRAIMIEKPTLSGSSPSSYSSQIFPSFLPQPTLQQPPYLTWWHAFRVDQFRPLFSHDTNVRLVRQYGLKRRSGGSRRQNGARSAPNLTRCQPSPTASDGRGPGRREPLCDSGSTQASGGLGIRLAGWGTRTNPRHDPVQRGSRRALPEVPAAARA